MMKAVVIGDLAIDMVATVTQRIMRRRNILLENPVVVEAGVAGNIAWYLAQLGVEAHVVGTVGDDPWGIKLKEGLDRAHVRTELVRTSKKPTGFFVVLVDKSGERTMIGSRGANTELMVKADEILKVNPGWIHVSGYSLLNKTYREILGAARKASKELSVPLSTDLEAVSADGRRINLEGTVAFCNKDEFRDYFGAPPQIIARRMRQRVVVKAGRDGCYLISSGGLIHFPSVAKSVVDTTGAGDAFNAGFIASVLSGNDESTACKWANAVAGLKVMYMHARAKLPRRRLAALLFKC